MSSFVFTKFKLASGRKQEDLSSDTLKLALFTDAYTPDQDNDTTYAGIAGEEVANSNGYVTGGAALASVVWAADNANHRAKLTAANVSWTVTVAITYRYAVLYNATSGDLIACFDPGSNQTGPSSGTINVNWSGSDGVLDFA